MKMHTFFLSGKALAVIGGSLVLSGGLLFATGLFVGVGIETAAADRGAAAAARQAGVPAESTAVASLGPSAADPAAWPFNQEQTPAAPAPAPESLPKPKPADTTKAKPAGRPAAVIGLAAYDEPAPAPVSPPVDTTTYLIQVGSFRVERNARALLARLADAGYKATITVHDDGDRPLHVVRVGRFKGMAAAERTAEQIGDAERLVASIVMPDNRR